MSKSYVRIYDPAEVAGYRQVGLAYHCNPEGTGKMLGNVCPHFSPDMAKTFMSEGHCYYILVDDDEDG